jgi:hypothetical protein
MRAERDGDVRLLPDPRFLVEESSEANNPE